MSVIQSLKNEGVLKLYSDFRSGTYDDFSGNSHDWTPVGTILKKEHKGYALEMVNGTVGTQYTTTANHADFDFGTSTDISVYMWLRTRKNLPGALDNRLLSNADAASPGGIFCDIYGNTPRFFMEIGSTYKLDFDNTISPSIDNHICFTIDRDVEGLGYHQGLLVDTTETNPGDRQNDLDSNSALQLGRVLAQTTNNYDGIMRAVLVVNRVLTATEVAGIYAELEGGKYPLKSQGKSLTPQKPALDTTGLVGAWVMTPQNGLIKDLSDKVNDGTITGGPTIETRLLGDFMRFDGVDDFIDIGNTGQTIKTIAFWVNPTTITEDIIDLDGGTHTIEVASGTLTATGFTSPTIYVDGAVSSSLAAGLMQRVVITTDTGFAASDLDIGKETGFFDGLIGDVQLYSDAKVAKWVSEDYNKGAKAAQYKTDWGVDTSAADLTSGEIASSNWQLDTGTFQVVTNEIESKKVKVIKSTTNNSIMYLPVGAADIDNTEAAYGTWEYWLYKGGDGNALHVSIKDEVNLPRGGSANGYIFRMGASERFRLRRETAGVVADLATTDAGFFNVDQWYKFKITRNNVGEFSIYIDDVLVPVTGGTNPVTNNTHTSLPYIVVDMDDLDMISFADIGGNHSLTKHLGIV